MLWIHVHNLPPISDNDSCGRDRTPEPSQLLFLFRASDDGPAHAEG